MSKLKVDVEVNSSKVAPGLAAGSQAIKKWATDLKGTVTTAFGAAAVTAAIAKTVDSIDNIGDSADRMGRTTNEIQVLAQMAQLAGRELGNVEMMLNNIAEAQVDALGGNEERMGQFNRMGISSSTLAGSNELKIAELMAKALQGKSLPEMRASGLTDIIGKKSVGTFAAIQDDLEDFETTLREKVNAFETIDPLAIAMFKQATDEIATSLKSLWVNVVNTFAPLVIILAKVLNTMLIGFETIGKWLGAFFGGLSVGGGKGRWANATDAFWKVTEEQNKKFMDMLTSGKKVGERLREQEMLSKMGPGAVPPKKKPPGTDREKPIWYKIDVPERMQWQSPGLTPLGAGGFTGTNTGLLGTIGRETMNILKKIEINTRQINAANGFNVMLEMMGRIFGVTVR